MKDWKNWIYDFYGLFAHTHTHTHTQTHTHTHIYIYICMYVYIHTYITPNQGIYLLI